MLADKTIFIKVATVSRLREKMLPRKLVLQRVLRRGLLTTTAITIIMAITMDSGSAFTMLAEQWRQFLVI